MNEEQARDILSRLGVQVLNRSSTGWLNARCPLAPYTHRKGTDNRPGFAVKINEEGASSYTCLSCHYKGRLSQLVRTLGEFKGSDYDVTNALAVEADRYDAMGILSMDADEWSMTRHMLTIAEEVPEPINEAAITGVYPPAYSVPAAKRYLERRRVGAKTAGDLELCYDPGERRILFPVRGEEGELYGFTGRSVLKEEAYPYANYPKIRDYLGLPKRALLLGMNNFRPGLPVVCIEGLIGYARFVEIGAQQICNPMAMLGSEMTSEKANILARWDEQTFLFSDQDEAGEAFLWGRWDKVKNDFNGDGAIKRLHDRGVLRVYIPAWPESVTDIDDFTLADVDNILRNCPMWFG